MRIKRIVIMSCFVFLVGGLFGGCFSLLNHTIFASEEQSVSDAVEGARDDWEVKQFVEEQERLHPNGLSESKVETGSKYTGITYNGKNNMAVPPESTTPKPVSPSISEKKEPEEEKEPEREVEAVSRGQVCTNGGTLRIRQSGDSNAAVVGQAKNGDKVIILSTQGDWYEVKTSDGLHGFASATFIRKI